MSAGSSTTQMLRPSRVSSVQSAHGSAPASVKPPQREQQRTCESAAASAADALTRFMNGELRAVPVTQREIARLLRLQDQGRGPEWRLQCSGAWTDQVMYLSIVAGGQEALSQEFLAHLLSPECQARLAKVKLLSATASPADYSPGSAMEAMQLSMLREGFTPSAAFNTVSEP